MTVQEISEQIVQLRLITKKVLKGARTGNFRTRLKGSGFEFDQLREYQEGDDIRFIDWNSSTRTNNLLVKSYFEERDRTIVIVLDCSASMECGSGKYSKFSIATQAAVALMCAAQHTKDNVGLCIARDAVPEYIMPTRSTQGTTALMEQVLSLQPSTNAFSLEIAMNTVLERTKKGSLIFVISDFIQSSDFKPGAGFISQAAHMHDVIAVRCLDALEYVPADAGYIHIQDPESHTIMLIHAKEYADALQRRLQEQTTLLHAAQIDVLDLMVQRPFIVDIVEFFNRRLYR